MEAEGLETMKLRDLPHAKMPTRTIASMRGYKVVLTDRQCLYMSPSQRSLYDSETGNARLRFLGSVEVVEFRGTIEQYLKIAGRDGNVK